MNGGICMKIQQRKKLMTAFYMAGFFIGILYANVFAKNYMTSTGIFSEYFLSQYVAIDVIPEEYMLYILRVRLAPLALLILAAQTRFRKLVVAGAFIWLGFSGGMLIVSAIMQLGVEGILLFLIGITPQFAFYAMAYIVLLWYFYTYPVATWNQGKTIFVLLTMALGILAEVYVNPILMKMFINAM